MYFKIRFLILVTTILYNNKYHISMNIIQKIQLYLL